MPVELPCVERLPDGRGCPEYAEPGGSRCRRHALAFETRRRAEGATGRRGTSPEWRRARGRALRRDKHRCRRCGVTEREERRKGRGLHVHHVDGNPDNNALSNLKTLCRGCHKTTHDELRAASRR